MNSFVLFVKQKLKEKEQKRNATKKDDERKKKSVVVEPQVTNEHRQGKSIRFCLNLGR
jgi:hypothetical protein